MMPPEASICLPTVMASPPVPKKWMVFFIPPSLRAKVLKLINVS